jgi:hypothetical protein
MQDEPERLPASPISSILKVGATVEVPAWADEVTACPLAAGAMGADRSYMEALCRHIGSYPGGRSFGRCIHQHRRWPQHGGGVLFWGVLLMA